MMHQDNINKMIELLPRDLLLDLLDVSVARAKEAHEVIRDRFPYLTGKNARAAEGQIRFRIIDQAFQQVCERHGGVLLANGLIQGTDLKVFQPFMRFGGDKPGIVLGFASMAVRGEMPVKNQSRLAGVTLNYDLSLRLPLDEKDPKPGDIFVLFLVARDRQRAGRIEEVAIGAIDSGYEGFLFYESIETFLARYAPPDKRAEDGNVTPTPKLVKLKKTRETYTPPETKPDKEDDSKEQK